MKSGVAKKGIKENRKSYRRSRLHLFLVQMLLLCFFVNLSSACIFAEPEDEYYEEGSEEVYEEYEEVASEEYYEESYEEYSEETSEGEYSEEYSEEYTWESDEYSGEYYEESEGEGNSEPEFAEEELDENGNPKPYTDTSKPPALNAKSAAIYCRNTGEIIFARNSDKRVLPYSVTKLLTALLAVQRLPLDQKVVVSYDAASQPGSSMDLYEGEEVTVEQLLYGTLILSGNDAAYALGEAVAGNMESFIKLMNETASNMGCKNTHFVNAHGYSEDVTEHYTTAKDMMDICKVAFANDTVNKIAGTIKYEMPETNISDKRVMESHNNLLVEKKEGYVSGKTGWMPEGNASLAMDYKNEDLELIVVIFEATPERRWIDCENLVKYSLANIKGFAVFQRGEIVGKVRVRHGAETIVEAATGDECEIYLPKEASRELVTCQAIMNDDVTAPIRVGDVVGKYQVYVAGDFTTEVPLVAVKDIEEGWFPSYVGISNKATLIGGGIIVLLILLIILRIIHGIKNRKLRKAAHKAKVRAMAKRQMEEEKKEFESHRGKFYK